MSNNIIVWIEQNDIIAWEALGAARGVANKLGSQLIALVLGQDVSDLATEAIQRGADSAIVADDATLKDYRLEPYAAIVTKVAREQQPAALLLGASNAGLELAAYVAAFFALAVASFYQDVADQKPLSFVLIASMAAIQSLAKTDR